jgi:hypothetical protein
MNIDTKLKINKKLLKNKNDFCIKELSTKLSKMDVKISFLYTIFVDDSC